MKKKYIKVFNDLDKWIKKNEYKSFDVCDINSTPLFLNLQNFQQRYALGKYVYFPFYLLSSKTPPLGRKLFGLEKMEFPQAYALIVRALIGFYIISGEKWSYNESIRHLEWLMQNAPIRNDIYAWGQPYDWFSRKKVPANTPRTTVTTQVIHAFLDVYEQTRDKSLLDVAEKSCSFFISGCKWSQNDDGDICFPYTSIDNYHIHNANVLAASALIRTAYYTKREDLKSLGIRALKFTAKHQNKDGSWYYWAPPDKIIKKIDHYHTGFILESFEVARRYLQSEFIFKEVFEKGLNFYLDNLFNECMIPKFTSESQYPIDIQSCAQGIITLGEILPCKPWLNEKLMKLGQWTLDNMYDKKNNYFYYRIYKNGKIDKTPYIRWGESWMLRALTFLIKVSE